MADLKLTGVGTKELWEQFKRAPLDVYNTIASRMKDAGIEEKPSYSRALEEASPTDPADKSGLDTFERLMMEAGIRTKTNLEAGYHASNAGEFCRNPGTRALLAEFARRQWNHVSSGKITQQERAVLLSDDAVIGSWERPFYDSARPRLSQQIAAAIPLSELVSMTTSIDGDAYRTYYLKYDAEKLRMYRVGETADIPIATIVANQNTIRLFKYGRGIMASYEELRRLRVDKLAYYIQLQALQTEIDKVSAALNILVNGDGNTSTAATVTTQSSLDSAAVAGTLTLKAWQAFKQLFVQPYMMTTALMNSGVALQLSLLNTGSGNWPLAVANLGGLGTGVRPINRFSDNIAYGWTSDAPALKIVAWDNRFGLERVIENGANIVEQDRYVTNQTQVLVISEVEGFATTDPNAARILDINS